MLWVYAMTEREEIREIVFRTQEWQLDAWMSFRTSFLKIELGSDRSIVGFVLSISEHNNALAFVKWDAIHGYSYDILDPVSFSCFRYIP